MYYGQFRKVCGKKLNELISFLILAHFSMYFLIFL